MTRSFLRFRPSLFLIGGALSMGLGSMGFGTGTAFAESNLATIAALPNAALASQGVVPFLKSSVKIAEPEIRLGDLFVNAGPYADRVVAASPAPGGILVFEAAWLAATARTYGLDWHPASANTAIRVERAAIEVSTASITTKLNDALSGGRSDRRVVLDNQVKLYAASGTAPELAIDSMDVNKDVGRFVAMVRVKSDTADGPAIRVSGRIEAMLDIPVLNRPISPGEVIRPEDISWTQIRNDAGNLGNIQDPREIVGKTTRRPLRADAPIRANDLQVPIVVKRNDLVMIVLERPGIYLTAEGKALEEGGKGGVIRVLNTQSNRPIEAVILGAGRVGIRTPGQQTAAY